MIKRETKIFSEAFERQTKVPFSSRRRPIANNFAAVPGQGSLEIERLLFRRAPCRLSGRATSAGGDLILARRVYSSCFVRVDFPPPQKVGSCSDNKERSGREHVGDRPGYLSLVFGDGRGNTGAKASPSQTHGFGSFPQTLELLWGPRPRRRRFPRAPAPISGLLGLACRSRASGR